MLPKARRLRLTRDFERVFGTGKSRRGRFFRLRLISRRDAPSRLAVVVSSKVSKRAVVRNRIRRRAWSVISALDDQLPRGMDIAVVADPEAAKADFSELRLDLESLLAKRPSQRL